jgi:CheY-like chemotaxis protein
VTVDAGELELALINLALNARDAMPTGGRVWLNARNAEEPEVTGLMPRPYVFITLTDEGTGIGADLADRVFEPFFTTKPTGKGTGLGLSQVHGFCAQAGGMARLASTPGLGTSVTMVLPAADTDAMAPDLTQAAPQGSIAGARVLLVEDNEQLGQVTAALLHDHGCTVHHAHDPEEALRVLATQAEFDVMLTDVVMPGTMDGVHLARLLKGLRPNLPAVLISGYSAALAQASDFVVLHKPCSREDLLAALHQAIHGEMQPVP